MRKKIFKVLVTVVLLSAGFITEGCSNDLDDELTLLGHGSRNLL